MNFEADDLVRTFALAGSLADGDVVERRLSDLTGTFADDDALRDAAAEDDRIVYTVTSAIRGDGEGDLGYGLGVLQPGRVGDEYHLTKGHLHAWRPAAEVYIGLRGSGAMLLQNEDGGHSRLVPFGAGEIVYVPGDTAHRTVNTGDEPLVYLGVYPARAGHDYGALAERNFRHVVLAGPDGPVLRERSELEEERN